MVSLPDGKKNFEDMFIRFDVIHERDERTDRHCVTADHAYASHRALKIRQNSAKHREILQILEAVNE